MQALAEKTLKDWHELKGRMSVCPTYQGPRFGLGTGRKLREMVESNVREPPQHAVRKKFIELAGGLGVGGVKMLAVNPDNLSSVPEPHTTEGENHLPQVVLQPPHGCTRHSISKCKPKKE